MSSYREELKRSIETLEKNNIQNAEYDAFLMLQEICNIDRTFYLINGGNEIDKKNQENFRKCIERRCKHEPLQHILEKTWFYGREFKVNSDVLVPRSDTEVLVEHALKLLKKGDSVLDMCTGSGCILITLAAEKELSNAFGVDISKNALEVAKKNIEMNKNQLKCENIQLINSDLFDKINSREIKFNMIISNPPYIRTDEIFKLSEEVKDYDPFIALNGMDDGLFFYRKITSVAPQYLEKGGWLLYEIGYDQAEDVSKIMEQCGFEDISVIKDLAGLDRVVIGKKI